MFDCPFITSVKVWVPIHHESKRMQLFWLLWNCAHLSQRWIWTSVTTFPFIRLVDECLGNS